MKHKKEFEESMRALGNKYAVDLSVKLAVGHDLSRTLEDFLSKDVPDILFMGASQKPAKHVFARNLSERIIDKVKCGVVVHHWRYTPSMAEKRATTIANRQ